MTPPALLDLTELADHADVPVDRLRHYAAVGLSPTARRDGDRYGYPPDEAGAVRLLACVEQLGITGDDLTGLATAWRREDYAGTRQHLTEAVAVRLATVQRDLADQTRQAAEYGPGSTEWATILSRTVTLTEHAARLQAVAALSGAALMLLIGVTDAEHAFFSEDAGIDWDVIVLLLGMMLIVAVLRRTGAFEWTYIRSSTPTVLERSWRTEPSCDSRRNQARRRWGGVP